MKVKIQSRIASRLVATAAVLLLAGCGGSGPTKSVAAPPPDPASAVNATAGAVMNTSGPQGPAGVIAAPPK